MSRSVAILGCGPAGLMAAYAADEQGFEPVVYSIAAKSTILGAQYLHSPIGDLTGNRPDFEIAFRKLGTREGYAQKLYGNPWASTSWTKFAEGRRPAWSLRTVYDRLWEWYGASVRDARIDSGSLDWIQYESGHAAVVSSIPAPALCENASHKFRSVGIWCSDDHWRELGNNEVVYNGEPNIPWSRSSLIDDWGSTEYPHLPANSAAKPGRKPIAHDCDCRPEVIRVGRFGQWKRGVLVDHAYFDASAQMRRLADVVH